MLTAVQKILEDSEPDGVADDDDSVADTIFVIRSDHNSDTDNDNRDKQGIFNLCTVVLTYVYIFFRRLSEFMKVLFPNSCGFATM